MAKRVLLIGTFDSKGTEYAFLRDRILANGCDVATLNVGVLGSTDLFPVDFDAPAIAAQGGEALESLRAKKDRGRAISVMSHGVGEFVRQLYDVGRFDAMIGMGGSGGTGIVTAAMRALPFGVPKLCISTLASGDVSRFIAEKDIVMFPSVADVSGINRISRTVLTQAAAAICGMVNANIPIATKDRPLIAASMFGNTTKCVDRCRTLLDDQGYETLVFHATGTGGRVLESLASDRLLDGVLDITTTEWADEICGGILTAGPDRLSAPGRAGIPHLIVPGCLDMCNFGPFDTVPERYRAAGRLFYEWSPEITLMRTNVEEVHELGKIFAEKALRATGPVAFLIPLKGFSMLDGDGEMFCDRRADQAFIEALRFHLNGGVQIFESDVNINDPEFADEAVELLLRLMGKS